MTIYVDMDGVIADFFSELARVNNKHHWKDIPDKEESIRSLVGTDFFARLPKFETSDELISFVNEVTDGRWCILSAPLRGDYDNSTFWKQNWLKKHGYRPKEAIFTGRKEKYAMNKDGTPNILIDDKPENIRRWIEKGGIGIRYQANENCINELKKEVIDKYTIGDA